MSLQEIMSIDSTVAAWHTQCPTAQPERLSLSWCDGSPSPIEIYNYGDAFGVFKAVPLPGNPSSLSRSRWHYFATLTEMIRIPNSYAERGYKTCNEFLILRAHDILLNMEQALGIEISSESDMDG